MEEKKKELHLKNLIDALVETDIAIAGGTVAVSSSAANATVAIAKEATVKTWPLFTWSSGAQIPTNFIAKIGEKIKIENKEGAIFVSPIPYSTENIDCFIKYNITSMTYDDLTQRLRDKRKKISELEEAIVRDKNDLIKLEAYSKARIYRKNIDFVNGAQDRNSKKKTLEDLVCIFAQDLHLSDIEINKRTPSSEIDIRAKNNRIVGIWSELGTPIIFEAKNWEDPVSADEIRNLVGKAKPAKTRLLIAWNGVTGKNELKSARLEIIKAKMEGIFVLVFTKEDFEKIAAGIHPEKIVENKYYALICDKVR